MWSSCPVPMFQQSSQMPGAIFKDTRWGNPENAQGSGLAWLRDVRCCFCRLFFAEGLMAGDRIVMVMSITCGSMRQKWMGMARNKNQGTSRFYINCPFVASRDKLGDKRNHRSGHLAQRVDMIL